MTWTFKDEAALNHHKTAVMELARRRQEAVQQVVDAMRPGWNSTEDMMGLCNWLIDHADLVRDVLAPFDSGARSAPERAEPDTYQGGR